MKKILILTALASSLGVVQAVEPIPFEGSADEGRERLVSVIGSMSRSKITEESDSYVRAEFTTAILRFVDDAEFLIDADAGLIHFRSASRIGHSDLGANRKRMAEFRQKFLAKGRTGGP